MTFERNTLGNIDFSALSPSEISKIFNGMNEKLASMSLLLNDAQRATNSGSFEYNFETEVMSWSDHNFEILGVNRNNGEPSFSEFIDYVVQSDQQYVKNTIEKTIKTNVPFDITYRWNRPDGKIRFINSIGAIHVDELSGAKSLIGTSHDVTEKKSIEDEIRISARKLHTITQTTHDGYYVTDKTGKFLETNPAFHRMIGFTEKELLRMRISDLEVMETHLETQKHIQKIIDQGWDQFVTKYRCKDGSIITVDISTTFISLNEPVFICFARDITTASTEKELLEARFRIEELSYNCSLDELLQKCLDETERLTDSKIGFYHFVDYDQENLQLQMWSTNTIENMCTAEGKGSHYPISKAGVWVDCVKTKKPVIHNNYEALKHKKGLPEGHAPVIRELVVPVIRGNSIKAILGVGNKSSNYHSADIEVVSKLADLAWDIVERKRAEELINKSEYKYRSLFNSLQQGVFYQNSNGKLLDANPAALELFGLTRDEFENRDSFHPGWFVVDENGVKLEPENHPSMIALKTGKPVENFQLGIYNPLRKEIVWMIVNAVPQFPNGGTRPSHVFVSMHDITKIKETQKALTESEQRYQELFSEAPVSIWEEDFSEVKKFIDQLNMEGVTDYRKYFDEHPTDIFKCASLIKIVSVNNESLRFFGVSKKEELELNLQNYFIDESWPVFKEEIIALSEGDLQFSSEIQISDLKGFKKLLFISVSNNSSDTWNRVLVSFLDNTDKKEAENKLRASEQRFRHLYEDMPTGSVIVDFNSRFVSVNKSFCKFIGYNEAELIGKSITDITFPEDANIGKEEMKKLFAGSDETPRVEKRYVRKDGEVVWGSVAIRLLRNDLGEPQFFIPVIEDITAKKSAEQALKESEEKYHHLFNGSPIGIGVADLYGNILDSNAAMRAITGYNFELEKNIKISDTYVDIRDREPFAAKLKEEGFVHDFEVKLKRKNGEVFDALLNTDIIKSNKEEFILTNLRDITKQKLLENELKESEEKWKTLVKTLPDYVALHTPQGKYQYLNHYAEGFHEDNVLDRHYSEFLTEDAVKVYDQTFQQLRTEKTIQIREYSALGGKGLIRNYESYFVPVLNGETLESIMIIARDVTERYSVQQQLKISEAKLSQAMIAARLGHWEHDLVSDILTFNDEFYALFKTDIKRVGTYQLTSKQYTEMFVHPEDQAIVPLAVKQALESKDNNESFRFEHKVLFGDGTTGYIAVQFKVIKNENGESVKTIGVNQDITERKLNEYLLKASEEKYRALFEANKDGVALFPFDETGTMHNFSQANSAATNLLGYTLTELLCLSAQDIEADLSIEKIQNRMKQLLLEGVASFDTELIHKNGNRIPAELKTSFVLIGGKKYLLTIARDITERKNAQKAISESERKYRLLAENMKDVIWIADVETLQFIYVSPSIEKLRGYTVEEVLKHTFADSLNKEVYEQVKNKVSKRSADFLTNASASKFYVDEIQQQHKNGSIVWTEVVTNFYFNEESGKLEIHGVSRDITERKKSDEILLKSEQRFRSYIDNAPDGVYVTNADGSILMANEAGCKLLGYTREELIGKNFIHITHPSRSQDGLKHFKNVLETGRSSGEIMVKRKNGESILLELEAVKLTDGSFLGFAKDITQRKKTEEALLESEIRYKSIVHELLVGIAIHVEGEIVFVNEAMKKMMGGNSNEEFLGRSILEFVYPEDRQMVVEAITSKLNADDLSLGGSSVVIEERLVKLDGTVITAEASAISLEYYGKQALMVMINDVTERKLAEKSLAESEQNLTTIINATPDIICFKDGNGRWLKANEGILNLYELTNVDYVGKTETELAEFTAPIYQEGFQICTETDEIAWKYGIQSRTEEVIPRANGEERVYDVFKIPSFNDDGSRKALVVFGRDITERKKLENTLRQSEEKFRKSFMTSPDSININRMSDGMYIDINEGFTKMTGYTLEDVKGKSSSDISIWVDIKDRERLVAELLEKGHCTNLEAKFRIKDGRVKTALMSAAPLMVNGEKCILSITRDMTERIEALEAVRASEEKFRHAFEYAATGKCTLGLDGKFQKVNSAFKKMLGYTDEEFHSLHFNDITYPEDITLGKSRFTKMLEGEIDSVSFEKRYVAKNGQVIWGSVSSSLVRDSENRPQFFISQIDDITARRKAEISLKESEERFKMLFELSPDAIFVHKGGIMLYANAATLKLLKYPSLEEFQKTTLYKIIHPSFHKIVKQRVKEIQATGIAAQPLAEKYVCYDQSVVDVEVVASELLINGEKAFQVLARDISERIKVENLIRFQRDMNFELISARTLLEASEIVFQYAEQILEVDCGGIYLVTDEKSLKLLNSFGLSQKFLKYIQFHASDTRNAQMASEGKSVFANYHMIKSAGFKEMHLEGIKSVGVVPLSVEGKTFAVLNLASRKFEELTESYKEKMETFAFQCASYLGRILAEQELKQSEEKFRKFFDADLAGDYKSTIDGYLLDCNPAFLKILEFDSKDQALSTNMKEIYPKEIHRKSLFAKLKREKTLELVETKLVTRSGREIIVIESMIAELDAKGKLVGASGFMIDVTQLKISERALKESEKNYRELFNRMQSGFAYHEVVSNRNGKVVDYRFLAVNPMFEKLTGLNAKNLLGRTVLEVMPDTEKYWIETYGKVALGGKPLRFEQYSREIGKYFKVLVYSPEKYKFATIIEDVTESKKTEEKVRQLSMAVEQSSAVVVITDKEGRIEYVNPVFTKLTGYAFSEIIGQNPRILKSGFTSEDEYKTMWRRIKAGKDWSGVFNNKKKNGELYWEAAVISPMRDSNGKITHFIAIKENITEKIKKDQELEAYKIGLEKMVEQRTQELHHSNVKLQEEVVRQKNTEALLKVSLAKEKELSELKTRFISTTSHEFRTPLTSILSSTELLQKYGKKWSEEKFAEHVDRTKRAVEYLVKLLEDVLTISRTESGKIGFDPVKMNLKDFCKDIIKETQSQAKENHKLVFKYTPKLKEFSLDPKLLKFILLNLIVNAYKYSPEGGEVLFIVSSNKKNVNFTISDQGIGIPDDEKPYIYDNFHRSKNSIDIPGTGLGLSIVQRSVDIHNGTISFVSRLNVGTTFKVSLPTHYSKDDLAATLIKSSIDQK